MAIFKGISWASQGSSATSNPMVFFHPIRRSLAVSVWKSQLIWHLGHRMRSKLEAFPSEVCLFAAVSDGYGPHFFFDES